jgi:hypothetical protein
MLKATTRWESEKQALGFGRQALGKPRKKQALGFGRQALGKPRKK